MASPAEDVINLSALLKAMPEDAPKLQAGGLQLLYLVLRQQYEGLDKLEDIVGLQGFLQTTVEDKIIYFPLRLKMDEDENVLVFLELPKQHKLDFTCEVDAETIADIFEEDLASILPSLALLGPVLLEKNFSNVDFGLLQNVHIPKYEELPDDLQQTGYDFVRGLLDSFLTLHLQGDPENALPVASEFHTPARRSEDLLHSNKLSPSNKFFLQRKLTPPLPVLTPQKPLQTTWNTGGMMCDLKTRMEVCLKMMGPLHNKNPMELSQKIALHSGQLDLISRDLNLDDFMLLSNMLLPPGILGPQESFSTWSAISAAIQERASGQSGVVDLSTNAKEVLKTSGILSAVDIIIANTATPTQVLDFLCAIIEDTGVKGALTMRLGYGFTTQDVKLAITEVWRSFRMPLVPEVKVDKHKQLKDTPTPVSNKLPQHLQQQKSNPPGQPQPFFNNRWRDDRRGYLSGDYRGNWNKQYRGGQAERFDSPPTPDHWQRNNQGQKNRQFSDDRPHVQKTPDPVKNKKQAPEDYKYNKRLQETAPSVPSTAQHGEMTQPTVPDSTWA